MERVRYRERWVYRLLGIRDCLVPEISFYFFCLCVDETGLMMSESANFWGYGCTATDTLRIDSVSDTTLVYGAGWGATTVDCVNYYDGNFGWGKGGVSVVSMVCGAVMARMISAVIFFTVFFIFPRLKWGDGRLWVCQKSYDFYYWLTKIILTPMCPSIFVKTCRHWVARLSLARSGGRTRGAVDVLTSTFLIFIRKKSHQLLVMIKNLLHNFCGSLLSW